jgi:hypothetical protein
VLGEAWTPDLPQLPVNLDDPNQFIARVDDHACRAAKLDL